ncbi:MAG: signal peptidase II [Hyphomicrobiaceae bacterium]|nr:signal peptidase II [Hyphomicrobiaceae bacterium]
MSESTDGGPGAGWLWGQWSRLALRVAVATIIADQAHKWWMILGHQIRHGERVYVAPFMDWVFVLNKGVSYSLLSLDSQTGQYFLAVFSVLVSVGLWVWLARMGTSRLMAASLGLIIGGAIGNAIDRITLGGVADFFSLHAFGYYWYVFNIADVAIVAGVIGLLYDSISTSRNAAANRD